ncbi:MAG: tRNA pseudouridine(55) synthase TruB [Lachnospiraceae bacterium]|nr:tRNA pseudouridine(55) synthase TruB [Lachnospiraceae bacterium]
MLNGVINIYKEKGYTSHDVVAKLRGILRQRRIGHTGTLDPDATGVLPVCIGSATKLCDMLTDWDKEYAAGLRLGLVTDTQDIWGNILEEKPAVVTEEEARAAVLSFLGGYAQLPPMYSALKVDGKRLYELAREGKEVERKPRNITIHELEILGMQLPEISLRVVCSKGTYIRTLCHDIGAKLGCGAVMNRLERTRTGQFTLKGAHKLDEIESLYKQGRIEEVLLPVDRMFEELAEVHVIDTAVKLVENGNSFFTNRIRERRLFDEGEEVRVYDTAGRFFGIYTFSRNEGRFVPRKMFLE